MIKLPDIQRIENDFFKVASAIFRKKITKINGLPADKKTKYEKLLDYFMKPDGTFYEEKIRKVICGKKQELIEVIDELHEMKDDPPNTANRKQYKELRNMYDAFIKKPICKNFAYKIGVSVCPYCNRQYITSLKNQVRPSYDHFFPQKQYPYLCISMYNLIPCCDCCNSYKGEEDTYSNKGLFFYPYEDEFGKETVFELKPKKALLDIFENNYNIVFRKRITKRAYVQKVNHYNAKLKLLDLYNSHKKYVNQLIKLRSIYNAEHVDKVFNTFNFSNIDEVKDVLYLSSLQKDHWGDIALSKLTSDILDFLDCREEDYASAFLRKPNND